MINLFQGDCLTIIPTLTQKFRLVLADLPYGISNCRWDTPIDLVKFWEVVKPILTEDGSVVMFGSQPFTTTLINSNKKMFKYCWIWKKQRGMGHLTAKKKPMPSQEDIVVFQKKLWYNPQMRTGHQPYSYPAGDTEATRQGVYGIPSTPSKSDGLRYPINVIEFCAIGPRYGFRKHPTQKPVDLLEYLIKTYSNEGDWVLDPTMGSGSCGVACQNTNRNFVGIELDPTYFQVAKERLGV